MAEKEENSQQLNNSPKADEDLGFPDDMLEAPSGMPAWALDLENSPTGEMAMMPEELEGVALTPPPDLPESLTPSKGSLVDENLAAPPDLPKSLTLPEAKLPEENLEAPPDLPESLTASETDSGEESLEPPPDLPESLTASEADLGEESLEPPPDLPESLTASETDLGEESLETPPDLPESLIKGNKTGSSSIIGFPDPLTTDLPDGSPTWAKALEQDAPPEVPQMPVKKNVVLWSTNPKLKRPMLDFTAVESDESDESDSAESPIVPSSNQASSDQEALTPPAIPEYSAETSEESLLPANEPDYLREPLDSANNTFTQVTEESSSPVTDEASPVVAKLSSLINRDQGDVDRSAEPLEAVINSIDTQIQQSANNVFTLPSLAATTDKDTSMARFLVFVLDKTKYAIPLDNVIEMATIPKITYVPNVPEWVRGVANMRGDILAIMELRSFIGISSLEQIETGRMLVVKNRRNSLMTGLIVDSVSGMRALSLNNIKSFSSPVANRVESFLQGLHNQDNETLVVLDLERLLSSPEIQQFERA